MRKDAAAGVRCILCGGEARHVVYEGPIRAGRFGSLTDVDYRVVRCASCSVDRLDPLPVNLDAYESGAYRSAVDGSSEAAAYHAMHDREIATRLALVGSAGLRGLVAMDVGCGVGSFLDAVKGVVGRTIGIEPQRDYADVLRRNGHAQYAYAADLAAEAPASVDVAFSFQVIEHVADPQSFLADVASCLKPGGRLHLTTPNRDDILMHVGPESYRRFFYRLVHLWYFDVKSLTAAAERAGFQVVRVSTPHHYDLSNFAAWLRDARPTGLGTLKELSGPADAAFREQISGSGRGDAIYAILEKVR